MLEGAVCSFDPDTQVLMADGTTKAIRNVAIGDSVEAADPSTGEDQGGRAVTALHRHQDDDLIDITVTGQDGKLHVVHTTARHPFGENTSQTWVPAGDLLAGRELRTVDGQHVLVASVRYRFGQSEMLNLTVGGLHTYYVRIGADAVLVHNTCGIPDPAGRLGSHVGPLHTVEGGADSAIKSVFSSGEDLASLKDAAAGIPVVENSGYSFRVLDAGRSIGTDFTTGQPTSVRTTVVTCGNGNLNTMYPGTPKWWGAP